uniref:WD_REPEATS_REGION domain-containing protein n=1 Tax=Steinernema glaseri TaxID=37863 RepID=A0A1I8A681_9BILA
MQPPVGMFHYMPPIYWHDRQSLLSIDISRASGKQTPIPVYKIATSSVQKEVRVWTFSFEGDAEQHRNGKAPLVVNFLSNLLGHMTTVNVVRFSPSGELIASGDVDGAVIVWKKGNPEASPSKLNVDPDMPPNKEFWMRSRPPFRHDSDVTDLAWNADSTLLCVASNDDSLNLYNVVSGKRVWRISNFRHFPNGIAWDPLEKYLVTLSTDRKMDIVNAKNGSRLKSFSQLSLGSNQVSGKELPAEMYRMFHDDTLGSFSRRADFTPGGELLIAPCGHLESGATCVYGLYVFKRHELNSEKPFAIIPTQKAPFMVRACPRTFKLLNKKDNFLGLDYRVVWAAITKDSLYIFDSQHSHPIAYAENLHYNNLTDVCWSPDGHMLVVSSLEGFNSFIQLNLESIGEVDNSEHERASSPEPPLIQPKKPKRRPTAQVETPATPTALERAATPLKEGNSPKTPVNTKSAKPKTAGSLLKFLKKSESADEQAPPTPSSPASSKGPPAKKAKKRVQVITLEDK